MDADASITENAEAILNKVDQTKMKNKKRKVILKRNTFVNTARNRSDTVKKNVFKP